MLTAKSVHKLAELAAVIFTALFLVAQTLPASAAPLHIVHPVVPAASQSPATPTGFALLPDTTDEDAGQALLTPPPAPVLTGPRLFYIATYQPLCLSCAGTVPMGLRYGRAPPQTFIS